MFIRKTLLLVTAVFSSIFPLYAYDLGSIFSLQQNNNQLITFIALLQKIVERLVPLLIGLAVLAFFWFLILFIWKGNEKEESRREGLKGMWWAILAIFVMVSIWGLVGFLGNLTGIKQGGNIHGFVLPGK